MRIMIIGGGPAGLLFGLLMKQQNPRHAIRVMEQNPADNTYGWGVVFSGRALEFLRAGVPALYHDLGQYLETWDDLTIVHRDEAMAIDGSSFSGIARLKLLEVLQSHCRRAGVDLNFDARISVDDPLPDADLVIGADGVNSQVRARHTDAFGTETVELTNHFVWYGTSRVFDTLSLIFREFEGGSYVAHTYRYSPTMSTFLVECDAATFAKSGLGEMTDAQSRAHCEAVFAKDLKASSLVSNHAAWRRFPMITNANWSDGNTVLLGDALRTVHFSIGSGTRTAMEDALELAAVFAGMPNATGDDVPHALAQFVQRRKPGADKLMAVASASIEWYENFASAMALDPYSFAMSYMTRGGRVSLENLRRYSPGFVARYESVMSETDAG